MRLLACLLVLTACGSKTAPPIAPLPDDPAPADATTAPFDVTKTVSFDELCTRARELAANHCEPFASWPLEMLDQCLVGGIFVGGAQACYLETECDRVDACVDYVIENGAPYRGPTEPCDSEDRMLPAGVSAAEMDASYGRTATKYSDAPSSVAQPIEVCGIPAEAVYLRRVTCDDGSQPFANFRAARQSRRGNAGPGGRCRRIIDRFVVPCPEREYEVFIDAYRCPASP